MVNKEFWREPTNNWLQGGGPLNDIVLSSRIRLARNLQGIKFPNHLNIAEQKEVDEKIKAAVEKSPLGKRYLYLALAEMTSMERNLLAEKSLISIEQAEKSGFPALLLRDDEEISIMINEEDHIRIQSFFPGLQLMKALESAKNIDQEMGKNLDYAYNNKFGYLTSCPTNVGTGLRASVMLHLPALKWLDRLERVFSTLPKLGLTVRGFFGEGSAILGDFYQISNQITLGLSEEELINNLNSVIEQVVEHEKQARLYLQKKESSVIVDNVCRAYGIIKYAHLISRKEAFEKLSLLRLGISLGIISNLDYAELNKIMLIIQPAFLQEQSGKFLDAKQRDWERGNLLREQLNKIKKQDENQDK